MDWSDRSGYDSSRYQKAKAELQAYLGGECAECGETEALEFDHIDPASKDFSIMSRWNAGIPALAGELSKCQLLCKGCHFEKSCQDKSVMLGIRATWEHGTISGYRYCRCGDCKSANSEYNRQYRAKRKATAMAA